MKYQSPFFLLITYFPFLNIDKINGNNVKTDLKKFFLTPVNTLKLIVNNAFPKKSVPIPFLGFIATMGAEVSFLTLFSL